MELCCLENYVKYYNLTRKHILGILKPISLGQKTLVWVIHGIVQDIPAKCSDGTKI